MVTTSTPTIRELMPDDYTTKISDMVRAEGKAAPYSSNLSDIVGKERITSKYWVYVERLALATDPDAYKARMAEIREVRGLNPESEE
ncbi:hypothetical protein [Pontibacter mangrovi]|uniref:Uncharacterized protein n=1 Tax=Pontibacter mangrovi TaxID=2589816 RepID=A0A501W8W2_9BACT|nr:hypothetical protein [Pontibacter mangrovi]TPE44965.1 hypothetical protein FJM65_08085 [Pontibacter mangrovi]